LTRPKKIPVVPVPDRPYYFFNTIDRATLFSLGGCGLLIQRAKIAPVVTLIIEPNCLNSSIGNTHHSLDNIDVGTQLQIAQQKTAKTMKKNIQKKLYFRPTDPNFFTI
jgi:uncharacterized protein (DUF1499 family)